MLGTYASLLILLGASALVGQAILTASGRAEPSPLAPAVGLAALCALAWWTVRLPGEGTAAIVAIAVVAGGSAVYLRDRLAAAGDALRTSAPVTLVAVALGSLPFLVEGRFGILGTGLNPDMSQHLFALDRLAAGESERLISGGYPLGPHSLVAALTELGPSNVQAFDGLMLAVAAAACLAALAVFAGLSAWKRFACALIVGFAYLVAASFVQGSFKETMQALFVLAFAIGLLAGPGRRPVPLAVLAVGSVYVYSFPGLLWLLGAAVLWAALELVQALRQGGRAEARRVLGAAVVPALVALAVLAVAVAPELGRMIDFASFETFDPDGAGLGNLFDRLSPLEALGIWPSGDFRVEPGDGAVPAALFYLGGAAGLAALGFGLLWWWRRGDRAVPAALAAALALWLYSLIVGTPYQEAKALVLLAPLAMLISARALAVAAPTMIAAGFLAAAGGSSALVLANGPVGPSAYSPRLAELASRLGEDSVVVYAPAALLGDQHGRDYLVWELRGHRVCVEEGLLPAGPPGPGVGTTLSVILDDEGAVIPGSGYDRTLRPDEEQACDFIPDGARADPGAAAG